MYRLQYIWIEIPLFCFLFLFSLLAFVCYWRLKKENICICCRWYASLPYVRLEKNEKRIRKCVRHACALYLTLSWLQSSCILLFLFFGRHYGQVEKEREDTKNRVFVRIFVSLYYSRWRQYWRWSCIQSLDLSLFWNSMQKISCEKLMLTKFYWN